MYVGCTLFPNGFWPLEVLTRPLVIVEVEVPLVWTHMMEVPQLHGFGPASNRLLEAYQMLLKVNFLCLAKIFFLKPMILSKLLNQVLMLHINSKFLLHQRFITEVYLSTDMENHLLLSANHHP